MKTKQKDYKSVITKNERLSLIALMHLAREAYKKADEYDDAMNKILGCKEKWGSIFSDAWLDDKPSVDELLKTLEIKVK